MIFKGLKRKSAQKFIAKQLVSMAANKAVSSKKIKRVGCIVDAESFTDTDKLLMLTNAMGLPDGVLSVIVYFDNKKDAAAYNGLSYCDNDFGWKGSVIGVDLNEFSTHSYDLLVNYYQSDKVGLQLASAHCKHELSVGFEGPSEQFNDLIINGASLNDTKVFADEVKKYLTILNKI